jgi:transposase-like protein
LKVDAYESRRRSSFLNHQQGETALNRSYSHKDVSEAVLAEALFSMELMQHSRELLLEFTHDLGMVVLNAVLNASAEEIAGPPHPGAKVGNIRHWGSQAGCVRFGPAKTAVMRPRLRDKVTGKEVPVPAYELLKQDPHALKRVLHASLHGVSSRDFKEVVLGASEAAGVSRSSISRKVVEASSAELEKFLSAPLEKRMLAVVIDGIRFSGHLVVGAIGVDESGKKHFLGLSMGATENAATVKSLLASLAERGLSSRTLFVIDGAKALTSAIKEVFGSKALIHRCRYHKRKNVVDKVPKHKVKYVWAKMSAAYKLGPKEGMERMLEFAKELDVTHPGAAASLREGLEETFTIDRLGLPPLLVSSLCTSNLIESAHSIIRTRTQKLKNAERGADVQRWICSAFLDAEKNMRTIKGHKNLWMLRAALDELPLDNEGVA